MWLFILHLTFYMYIYIYNTQEGWAPKLTYIAALGSGL